MFVFLCIDFMMVLLYLIIGILFIRSNGRAIRYLTGHLLWAGAGLILATILNAVLIFRLMVLRDHFENGK